MSKENPVAYPVHVFPSWTGSRTREPLLIIFNKTTPTSVYVQHPGVAEWGINLVRIGVLARGPRWAHIQLAWQTETRGSILSEYPRRGVLEFAR